MKRKGKKIEKKFGNVRFCVRPLGFCVRPLCVLQPLAALDANENKSLVLKKTRSKTIKA